jgi:hypothetical protein
VEDVDVLKINDDDDDDDDEGCNGEVFYTANC